jgi:hypothetical protein
MKWIMLRLVFVAGFHRQFLIHVCGIILVKGRSRRRISRRVGSVQAKNSQNLILPHVPCSNPKVSLIPVPGHSNRIASSRPPPRDAPKRCLSVHADERVDGNFDFKSMTLLPVYFIGLGGIPFLCLLVSYVVTAA